MDRVQGETPLWDGRVVGRRARTDPLAPPAHAAPFLTCSGHVQHQAGVPAAAASLALHQTLQTSAQRVPSSTPPLTSPTSRLPPTALHQARGKDLKDRGDAGTLAIGLGVVKGRSWWTAGSGRSLIECVDRCRPALEDSRQQLLGHLRDRDWSSLPCDALETPASLRGLETTLLFFADPSLFALLCLTYLDWTTPAGTGQIRVRPAKRADRFLHR